ncbi:NAD(P)-dependent oxidoreductase [Pedobacter rhodius]|uniref:NAD(P)-dependent oxidoreductase n=1 Tax=Pedobacter rhodius TaxID=3004098 RepID=A0ABT4KSK3_9SPHI|nr:NAD(P)-dependent oxidoreductase [Pedobacter sp. SJ11]MCZ4221770.1 NAD(P)-dependent oxidoreductase [Pedobacter sp. SJ11]
MEQIKIGWIGLGNMGIPMAEQLIKAEYNVKVYNRNKIKEEALKNMGASIAASPKELLNSSDIVFLMVSDDEAINQIFKNKDGLLNDNSTGKIIINMSTVSPGISLEMAALCKEQGNFYLDAPVSGSVKQAETGTLVIMVGGDEHAFEIAKPVLEKLGKLAMHIGENGAGNNAKLAINSLLALYAQGLAETVLFANQQGVKTEDLLNLINNAAIGNIFTKIKGDAILQDNYKAAFALKHIVKDLGLAKAEGLSSPLGSVAFEVYKNAAAQHGEEDIISVIKALK